MSYEESLAAKQKRIGKLLKGLPLSVLPIIPSEPYYYRNKVHAAFGMDKGRVICGMYEPNSHRIVENADCLLENRTASDIIITIRELTCAFRLPVYDERRGTGVIRRVLIRTADATGEVLVVIVTGANVFPGRKNFVRALLDKHPEITSVVININNRRDSMILGSRSEVVHGRGYITDILCGLKFRISPESFYQINRKQTEKLYAQAIALADIRQEDKVLDAYCGVGTIGLSMSKVAGKVTGVELNSRAVKDAITNARQNEVKNAYFIEGDATRFMMDSARGKDRYDVVVLDPPRSGTTPEFIKACRVLSPRKIVYVSCNPETLARDLPLFMENGYKPVSAVPVDMFPWTDSIETVVSMEKDPDDGINQVIKTYGKTTRRAKR